MKKNFTSLFAILLLLFSTVVKAQTQFWSDTFEDSGAPSSGARSSSYDTGGPSVPYSYYFLRTDGSNIALQPFLAPETTNSYQGIEGTKFWAGEDIDKVGSGSNDPVDKIQDITWSGINISGKSGLSFKGLFAANSGHEWQDIILFPDSYDFLEVEYSIDGSAWTLAGGIYAETSGSGGYLQKRLRVDTNGDKIGDGAYLSRTFQEIGWDIAGTGTTLDLRFRVHADGATIQEFAIDNFRLFETPACTAPTIASNPVNRNICAGSNTTFTGAATGATAYKWQVDATGGGTYTDIANGAPYSGANTATLTITAAPASLNGYRYRMVAINGVATCYTDSNYATLNVSNITTTGSQNNIACGGSNTGSAAVIASGGIGTYTYSWSPSGGTGSIATNLSAGNYTVTVTDNIGCTATHNFTITEATTAITATTVVTNVACFGGSTGAINLTPTGGTGSYSFSWSDGPTTEDRSNLVAGTYSVTITDQNGCEAIVSITVSQPTAALDLTSGGGKTDVSCFGGSNGTATVAPTGGTSGYTYSWAPSGGTAATATGLAAGTYAVTVTDAFGCQDTRSFTIDEPSAPLDNTTLLTGDTISANQNGATYQWYSCPNTILTGETGQSFTATAVGSYKVVITNGACEVTSDCVTISSLSNPDFAEKSKFIMFPNPSKGIVNIECDYDGELTIINQLGQTVKKVQVSSGQLNTLNIGNLANGVYFISEIRENKVITHKLILNK
jgi:hypothetical protein